MKNILVVYYTQSGQLKEIVDSVVKPIAFDDEIAITYYKIEMEKEFPFPWKKNEFFDVFPESFMQIPSPIKNIDSEILSKKYDLVILSYQVWYLTPAIPVVSFLKSENAQKIFNNTPVVTITGSRNMWIMAQEKMKVLLSNVNATLVGNVALVDRNLNHISVITIVQWMFTGEKKKYLGVFPKPGVSEKDINEASKFGTILLKYFNKNSFDGMQEELVKNGAIEIRPFLITMDRTANRMFEKWARLILGSKKRSFLLKMFNLYLLIAIWIMSPIVYLLHLLIYPVIFAKIRKEVKYFKGV